MSQSIYKVFHVKFKEAWYQLSKPEQDSLLHKVEATLAQVGGKTQVLCNSNWSSETWMGFGLEIFPNIEAVQKHDQLLQELNWFRYVDSFTSLGTEWSTS